MALKEGDGSGLATLKALASSGWTDPDEVAAWYGPAHMEVPRDSVHIDARIGGRWEVTMIPSRC